MQINIQLTRIIDPSSRPHTSLHCIGKKMVAVKAASVSGLSNWFRTPAGDGFSPVQISSKPVAVLGFKILVASPFSCNQKKNISSIVQLKSQYNNVFNTFFNCILAHSGVSGIFHKAIFPLASPRIKYFIHFPSRENMRYLKAGGQCSGGCGKSITSSQKSMADLDPPASVLERFKNCLDSTMQLVGNLYK